MLSSLRRSAVALGVSLLLALSLAAIPAWAQPAAAPWAFRALAAPGTHRYPVAPAAESVRPFSQLAVGVKFSTLGAGVEVATPLSGHFNLRVGGNFFQYTDHLTTNGIHYAAALNFSSAQASIDWFPWGRSFHVSPGALVYSGNRIIANGSVPGGTSFTINGNDYVSDLADPVGGSARIDLAHAAPMLTFGWGASPAISSFPLKWASPTSEIPRSASTSAARCAMRSSWAAGPSSLTPPFSPTSPPKRRKSRTTRTTRASTPFCRSASPTAFSFGPPHAGSSRALRAFFSPAAPMRVPSVHALA